MRELMIACVSVWIAVTTLDCDEEMSAEICDTTCSVTVDTISVFSSSSSAEHEQSPMTGVGALVVGGPVKKVVGVTVSLVKNGEGTGAGVESVH